MFNLKGLFFEEEKEQAPLVKNTKDKVVEAAEVVLANHQTETPSVAINNNISTVNEDVLNTLYEAIEKANIDGYDYFEYEQSLQAMMNSCPGLIEQQIFTTTFAMAKSMKVTKSKLLSSIDHYVSILENKRNVFLEYFASVFQEKVQLPLDKIQSNTETVNAMQQQIVELNQKIQELRQENFNLQTESDKQKTELDNTKNSFDYTFNTVVNKLKSNQSKIENYIEG